MEFEGYKSVWLNEEKRTSSPSPASVNSARLQLLRSSAYRDWERTREKSRIFFSFLFALSAAGAAFAALPSGTGPIAALLLAAALFIQGVTGSIGAFLVSRESDRSIQDYLGRAHRHATFRFRLERLSQASLLVVTAVVLVLVIAGPRPLESPTLEMDRAASMLILTALLVMAWLKARSVALSRQIRQELEGYLEELER